MRGAFLQIPSKSPATQYAAGLLDFHNLGSGSDGGVVGGIIEPGHYNTFAATLFPRFGRRSFCYSGIPC